MQVAMTVDEQLGALGGQRLLPCGRGDEDTGKMEQQFAAWSDALLQALREGPPSDEAAVEQTEGVARSDGCATHSYTSPSSDAQQEEQFQGPFRNVLETFPCMEDFHRTGFGAFN